MLYIAEEKKFSKCKLFYKLCMLQFYSPKILTDCPEISHDIYKLN